MSRRIVVDTNVLVSAVLSPDGGARAVLRTCLTEAVQPLIGNALFLEYEDVFARDDIFAESILHRADRDELLDAFLSVCRWINVSFLWLPNLRDEGDNHLVELAVAGNAEAIVTGNLRDFRQPELKLDPLRVITPAEMIKEGT